MKILYKILFDINLISLHQAVEWLTEKKYNLEYHTFDFNDYYYIFIFFDRKDVRYKSYKKLIELIDDKKGIYIKYLIEPNQKIINDYI